MKIWITGLLIAGATKSVEHEIKKQKSGFLGTMKVHMAASSIALMTSSMMQLVVSSLINAITAKAVKRAGKRNKGGFLPLLTLPLMMKGILRKGVTPAGRGYNKMEHMDKKF